MKLKHCATIALVALVCVAVIPAPSAAQDMGEAGQPGAQGGYGDDGSDNGGGQAEDTGDLSVAEGAALGLGCAAIGVANPVAGAACGAVIGGASAAG